MRVDENGIDYRLNRAKVDDEHKEQRFRIPKMLDDIDLVALLEKYRGLVGESYGRMWRRYFPKKGVTVPLGKSSCAEVPCVVATALGLPNPETYTGHGLRATGCVLMYLSGAKLVQMMRAGNWASEGIVLEYIRNSDIEVKQRSEMIAGIRDRIPAPQVPLAPQPVQPSQPVSGAPEQVETIIERVATTAPPTYFVNATFYQCTFN